MPRPSLASALAILLACLIAGGAGADPLPAPLALRGWIDGMKRSERGPFESIRWFCSDGSIEPARAGCGRHGGGVQHGDWNARAVALREGGYQIANVLTALAPERFVGPHADLDGWRQVLLERFLVGFDGGWIFRGAYGYRGAFQIEDEEVAARKIVLAMLADPRWRSPARFALLRDSVRLLPIARDQVSAASVRTQAGQLAARDPGFAPLRAKIHSFPDGGDSRRVLDYAARHARPALAAQYATLAREIDALYAPQGAAAAVLELAPRIGSRSVARQLRDKSAEFQAEVNPGRRIAAAANLMRMLREQFPKIEDPETALIALLTSLALEREIYAAGAEAVAKVEASSTRRSRLWLLAYDADALYGAGLLSARERGEVDAAVKSIESRNPPLRDYRAVVSYLARVPEWSGRMLELEFGTPLVRWAEIEPLARQYAADRLRGSPLLFYGGVLDGLVTDANRKAGVQHEVFGEPVAAELRALNPGLARGVLRTAGSSTGLRPDGIYLLPETTSDLPPVAGILTRGEGSSLSHVSLLARNLGIPNVVVGGDLVGMLTARANQRSVLAVSPGGVVRLEADGAHWDAVFGPAAQQGDSKIAPDLDKLDLATSEPIPLSDLRAVDSGRVCGPKGANLGELRFAFGDAVPDGFVIPFGAFRHVLEQPIERGGPSAFEWMKARYDEIERASGARRPQLAAKLLARLRDWIAHVELGPGFEAELRENLKEHFGRDGSYGVFVRSDTNVEDLPGFTGAGLNQTIPNVIGSAAILRAIREVWASPFSERAYAWRQAHMDDPEYVFPAVVVQRAFASEKSGVMVTLDVETGDPRWITVATNEGVGGAVDGQAAESLLVDAKSGATRLLAQAAAPTRRVLAPRGGLVEQPTSGDDVVLERNELKKLVRLARDIPKRLPALRDPVSGQSLPADVEFAFRDGELALLQIRPFNQSRRAQRSQYLAQLDAGSRERGDQTISIGGVPDLPPGARDAALQAQRTP